MLRYPYLFLVVFFCSSGVAAQSDACLTVLDAATNVTIDFATVVVYSKADSTIFDFGNTNAVGTWCTKAVAPIDRYVTISHLNYQQGSLPQMFNDGDTIRLNPKEILLQEVMVRKRRDVVVKRDTVTFDVQSFIDSTESSLEDILGKLPGISVNRETGDVTVLGKPLESILLEDDNVTGQNYKLTSKNLPAYAVRQVQIIKNYGVDDPFANGRLTALNVKVNDEAKDRLIGKAALAAGNRRRADGTVSAIMVGKRVKSVSGVSYNNIGTAYFGSKLTQMGDDEARAERSNESLAPKPAPFVGNSLVFPSGISQALTRSNSEMLFTNNTTLKTKRGASFSLHLIGTKDDNAISRQRQVFFPGTDVNYRSSNLSALGSRYLSAQLSYSTRLDSNTQIKLSVGGLSDNSTRNSTARHSILDSLTSAIDNTRQAIFVRASITRVLSKNFSLRMSGLLRQYQFDSGTSIRYDEPPRTSFFNSGYSVDQLIDQRAGERLVTSRLKYAKDKLTVYAGLGVRQNKIDVSTSLRSTQETEQEQIMTFISPVIDFSVRYESRPDEQINFKTRTFNAAARTSGQDKQYRTRTDWDLTYQRTLNFLHNFTASASATYAFGKISDYYPGFFVTSPLSAHRGSFILRPNREIVANGGYSYENYEGDFLLSLTGSYSALQSGRIEQYTFSENGFTLREFLPGSQPSDHIRLTSVIEYYLPKQDIRIKLKPGFIRSTFTYLSEDNMTVSRSRSYRLETSVRNGTTQGIGFHGGVDFHYNKFSTNETSVDYPYTVRAFLDLQYSVAAVQLKLANDYYLVGEAFSTAFYALDLKANWQVKPGFIISLKTRNLLDQPLYREVNNNPYLITTNDYSIVRRMVLVGVQFSY